MSDLEKAACEYFLLLSRTEYALKKGGFVKANSDHNAQPDWNEFKNAVHDKIELDFNDNDIKEILRQRPARQLYKDGTLGWSDPEKISDADKKALIDACLTIRNNLFHGGKHGDGNAGRNETLIKAATKILTAAITACPSVKTKFDSANL